MRNNLMMWHHWHWRCEEGIDTQTQANAIENVKAIDRVLGTIFTIVAATSIIGCILSLSGSFLANIERKRKRYFIRFVWC